MAFRSLAKHRFVLSLWTLFIFSILLKISPPNIEYFIPKSISSTETYTRSVDIFFNLVLATLSFLAGSLGGRALLARPRVEDYTLPIRFTEHHNGYAEPCKKIVVYDRFPSFITSEIQLFLRRSVLYANYRVLFTSSLSELENWLSKSDVTLCICDRRISEEIVRFTRQKGKSLVTVYPEKSGKFLVQRGNVVSNISLPTKSLHQNSVVEAFSEFLVSGHSLDTPRGIGFHGNWAGTYGLLCLHNLGDFEFEGHYFYANGSINGKCFLDIESQILILEYKWRQEKNENIVGSRSLGDGIFVIPAGHEFFFGFWRDIGDLNASQTWCGARLSQDITESIRSQVPPYGDDFGLSVHSRSKLVGWGVHQQISEQ